MENFEFTRGKVIAVVLTALLLGGIATGIYLVQTQQVFKSKALEKASITITSPSQGENIQGLTIIKAKTSSKQVQKYLHGVLKIDGKSPQTLRVTKSDAQTVSLSTVLDTKTYPKGQHTLAIYLYDLSSGKPVLIGSGSIQAVFTETQK